MTHETEMPPQEPPFDPYATGQWPPRAQAPSSSDFSRLETRIGDQIRDVREDVRGRLDSLQELMQEMIRVQSAMGHQERRIEGVEHDQSNQAREIALLRKDTDTQFNDLRGEVSKWVNRGIGAWFLVVVAWTLWEKLHGQ